MRQVSSPLEWKSLMRSLTKKDQSLGIVPTMGALHEGHFSLIQQSQKENDHTVVSIFVNPTQFNDPEDFKKYPLTLDDDLRLLQSQGVEYVFTPSADQIYPDHYRYRVRETELSLSMEGKSRPGHFEGMLTIVLKLLILTGAHRAYFGEKDYQQYLLVKDLAKSFFLETDIRPQPTVREPSGLALSSRNKRLTKDQNLKAAELFKELSTSKSNHEIKTKLEALGFEVDYVEEYSHRRLAAVKLGDVRLIDNVPI